MNCFVSLPYTGAVHDVLANAPLPHFFALWLCIRMCRSAFPSPRQPSPLFYPQTSCCVCVLVCSCAYVKVVSAGGFVWRNWLKSVSVGVRGLVDQAGLFLINFCLSQVFSLWHFDGLVTHLQVPTSFWACASYLLSTVDMPLICFCTSQHVPLCDSLSQGEAAQHVSAIVSLAWDPAGPGLRGLSVLAAACCRKDNALTHTGTDRNQWYS